jgi:GTP cyclohydrolase I
VAVKAEEPSSNRVRSRNRVSGYIPSERETLEYLIEMMLKEMLEKLNIELDDEELKRIKDRAYKYALDYTFDYEAGEPEGILMSAAKGVRDAIVEHRDLLRSKIEKKQPNP